MLQAHDISAMCHGNPGQGTLRNLTIERVGNQMEVGGRDAGQRQVGGVLCRWSNHKQMRLVGGGGLRFVEIRGADGWF